MKKTFLKKIFVSLVCLSFVVLPFIAKAQLGLDEFGGQVRLGKKSLTETIADIINVVLGFLGVVAVVIILIGGFIWMTAGGNEDKVKNAKKILTTGVIGLAIVLSAYAIAQFVVKSLVTATGTESQ